METKIALDPEELKELEGLSEEELMKKVEDAFMEIIVGGICCMYFGEKDLQILSNFLKKTYSDFDPAKFKKETHKIEMPVNLDPFVILSKDVVIVYTSEKTISLVVFRGDKEDRVVDCTLPESITKKAFSAQKAYWIHEVATYIQNNDRNLA